jgi:uncharacterized protein (UPF0548 family)
MFNLGWVQLAWPSAPISIGTIVATVVAHFGFYSLNASRIVYVMDETESVRRFGFAYGTLQDHSERGEERFSVEWNTADNTVHYDLFASSKPNANIVKWTKPLARTLQRRFAVESVAAMQRAIK